MAFSHLILLWRGAHCWQAWFIIWAVLLCSLNLMELGLHAFLPQCLCGPCELSSRSAVLTYSDAFLWLKTHFGEFGFQKDFVCILGIVFVISPFNSKLGHCTEPVIRMNNRHPRSYPRKCNVLSSRWPHVTLIDVCGDWETHRHALVSGSDSVNSFYDYSVCLTYWPETRDQGTWLLLLSGQQSSTPSFRNIVFVSFRRNGKWWISASRDVQHALACCANVQGGCEMCLSLLYYPCK